MRFSVVYSSSIPDLESCPSKRDTDCWAAAQHRHDFTVEARCLRERHHMAVREFRDESGHWWRAWDIKPEEIHPVTRAEDYLADCYVTGWIVFESKDGAEKRRLCPWPMRWTQESEQGLRRLLARATPVPPFKLREERETPAVANVERADVDVTQADVTDLEVIRTFRYPGGRVWTVCVIPHPETGWGPVLRFQSGIRFFDLRSWPKAWADEPDERLAEMLRNANPRRPTAHVDDDTPRRRWNDQPSMSS
jgi:hypothetical protein